MPQRLQRYDHHCRGGLDPSPAPRYAGAPRSAACGATLSECRMTARARRASLFWLERPRSPAPPSSWAPGSLTRARPLVIEGIDPQIWVMLGIGDFSGAAAETTLVTSVKTCVQAELAQVCSRLACNSPRGLQERRHADGIAAVDLRLQLLGDLARPRHRHPARLPSRMSIRRSTASRRMPRASARESRRWPRSPASR